jgi:hypothetical protein
LRIGGKGKKIWVLGGQSPAADKSIRWNQTFPNFSDADIIVINLDSLDEATLEKIDETKFFRARDLIWDRFNQGGTLTFITSDRHEIADHYLAGRVPQFFKFVGYNQKNRPRLANVKFPVYFFYLQ